MTFREDTGGGATGQKLSEYSIPVTALHGTSRIWDNAGREELTDKLAKMVPGSYFRPYTPPWASKV